MKPNFQIKNKKALMGEVLVDFTLFVLFIIIIIFFVILTNSSRNAIEQNIKSRAGQIYVETEFNNFIKRPVIVNSLPSTVLDIVSSVDLKKNGDPYTAELWKAGADFGKEINWDTMPTYLCKLKLKLRENANIQQIKEFSKLNQFSEPFGDCTIEFYESYMGAPNRIGQEGNYGLILQVYAREGFVPMGKSKFYYR